MAVKCMIFLTIVSFLGVVCARELKLASKYKADPGIFISLDTLRRLEGKVKNKTESNTTTTTTTKEPDNVENEISTTSPPDNEINPNDSKEEDSKEDDSKIITPDVKNQTCQSINSNDTTTDGSLDKPGTSNEEHNPNQAQSQQGYENIKWAFPQHPYGAVLKIFSPNPYPRLSFGTVPNQQNPGYFQINPFNEQLIHNDNDSKPFSNPQASFNLNQQYPQTYIVQHPYPGLNQPTNPPMKFMSLNPFAIPFPYSQK